MVQHSLSYSAIHRACIGLLTRRGGGERAHRIWRKAMMYIAHEHTNVEAVVVDALASVAPVVETRRVRVAGSNYHVPSLVPPHRAQAQGLRWILAGARRRGYPYWQCLAQELLDASRGHGWAVSQRVETHRMAEANRAYIRYQWW